MIRKDWTSWLSHALYKIVIHKMSTKTLLFTFTKRKKLTFNSCIYGIATKSFSYRQVLFRICHLKYFQSSFLNLYSNNLRTPFQKYIYEFQNYRRVKKVFNYKTKTMSTKKKRCIHFCCCSLIGNLYKYIFPTNFVPNAKFYNLIFFYLKCVLPK